MNNLEFISQVIWFAFYIIVLIVALDYFGEAIRNLLNGVAKRVREGDEFEFQGLKLRGTKVVDDSNTAIVSNSDVQVTAATEADSAERKHEYSRSRHLELVHRCKPAKDRKQYFDIEVSIRPHIRYHKDGTRRSVAGRLNDVSNVSYYFGELFGGESPNGAVFTVTNSIDNFAVQTSAYGPLLCRAIITFHDGSTTTLWRYLDLPEAI